MGLDARAKYTRMVIEEALLSLLREKPVAKITVTELCGRADINRATFYKHYQDVADLMEKIEERLLQNLTQTLHLTKTVSLEEILLDILRYMRAQGDRYMALGSDNGDPGLAMKTFLRCYEYSYPVLERNLPNMPPNKRKMLYHFLSQGCGGILAQWVLGGMSEEPEEVAAFLVEMCIRVVR